MQVASEILAKCKKKQGTYYDLIYVGKVCVHIWICIHICLYLAF
jgi:hypothetical protein